MKSLYFGVIIVAVCAFFIGCSTTKDTNTGNSSQSIQNTSQRSTTTTNSQWQDQNTSNIIVHLRSDLGKSVNTLLSENPNAVSLRGQGYPNTIVSGRGGVFGSGQFYGYSWELKNGFVDSLTYLQPFDEKIYQDSVNVFTSVFGQGIDLNGNGFGWLVPEKGGITIALIKAPNNFNIYQSSMGYADSLIRQRDFLNGF